MCILLMYTHTAVRTAAAAAAAVAASTKAFASDVQQENDKMWLNPNARTTADASTALAVSTHTLNTYVFKKCVLFLYTLICVL
jgi:hypothetical protein